MTSTPSSPQQIFIIRHGEKPADDADNSEPPFGIDINGNPNPHSLIPRGWQRSGALAVLFAPAAEPIRAGLAVPDRLHSPSDANPQKVPARRTTQTIQALSDRTTVPITAGLLVGDEQALADAVLADPARAALICWEHHRIPVIAAAIPTTNPAAVPTTWPEDRFDLIWSFSLNPADQPRYVYNQIPQQLLADDTDPPSPTNLPPTGGSATTTAHLAGISGDTR